MSGKLEETSLSKVSTRESRQKQRTALDQWAPGRRIPDFALPDPLDPVEEEENVGGSEEEVGDVRSKRPQHQA